MSILVRRGAGLVCVIASGVACLALAACASSGESRTTVEGFPHLVAEAGMRIGSANDPDTGFSWLGAADVDRDGNVYALDGLAREIRVFGPDGTFLRRIGRKGDGPGEFPSLPRFGVVGDTVWALTLNPARITLFRREGTLLSASRAQSLAVSMPALYGLVVPYAMRPDGKFTSMMATITSDRTSEAQPTDSFPWPFVLFDATGAVTDTLGWAPRPPPQMWRPPSERDADRFRFIHIGDRPMMVPDPPPTAPWWGTLTDGYLVVESPLAETGEDGAFTVTRIGFSGDTAYSRTFHYRPIRYSSADLDSVAARAARTAPGGGLGAANVERVAAALRAAMKFPEFKTPIENDWLAQDGSLWLRLTDSDPTTAHWIVLDARGTPRGALELPSKLRILWNRGDTFWAAVPDENDVPWLVRYRMRSASR